jgi:addiction module HigA family antidote
MKNLHKFCVKYWINFLNDYTISIVISFLYQLLFFMNELEKILHPGKFIKEKIEKKWRSQTEFAKIIWLPISEVNDLLNWRRNLSPKTAIRMAVALKVSAEKLLRLQNLRDLHLLSKNEHHSKILQEIKNRILSFVRN